MLGILFYAARNMLCDLLHSSYVNPWVERQRCRYMLHLLASGKLWLMTFA